MNAILIIAIGLFLIAGILAVTLATVFCMVRHACEERDRQLFHAYVHAPHELEAWLIRGALHHVRQALSLENSHR